MALLARCGAVVAALLSGCYSPSLRDCTVSCSAAEDCATGQVCGIDGMCAAPSVAGRCADHADAGAGSDAKRDAAATDAVPADAAHAVDLHVKIDGRGTVNIDLIGVCDTDAPNHGDCHFALLANIPATLREVESHGFSFDKWTGACTNGSSTCVVTSPGGVIDVHARFKN